jgi:hypothetical protein
VNGTFSTVTGGGPTGGKSEKGPGPGPGPPGRGPIARSLTFGIQSESGHRGRLAPGGCPRFVPSDSDGRPGGTYSGGPGPARRRRPRGPPGGRPGCRTPSLRPTRSQAATGTAAVHRTLMIISAVRVPLSDRARPLNSVEVSDRRRAGHGSSSPAAAFRVTSPRRLPILMMIPEPRAGPGGLGPCRHR